MKYIGKLFLGVLLLGMGWVYGQQCWIPDSANARLAPSFLALITGNYPRPPATAWDGLARYPQYATYSKAMQLLYNGKAPEALQALETHFSTAPSDSLLDTLQALDRAMELEVAALAALVDGKLDAAHAFARRALQFQQLDFTCRLTVEPLVASYLKEHGMQAPLFPHFNGGFYNYVSDSLRWGEKADHNGYFVALNTVALLYRLDQKRQALYLELLGDLLSKEPNRFNANYMAALAYMRAGQLAGGSAQAAYDRKAIFALEAPRQAENRFNQYRFVQLKKALQIDADSAASRTSPAGNSTPLDPLSAFGGLFTAQLSTAAYFESDPGQLPAILAKSKSQIAARESETKRYAGDVDLKKEVKKDSRFNSFALLLILTIVAAIIFIWMKLRKASR